jgi:adenylate cyclase
VRRGQRARSLHFGDWTKADVTAATPAISRLAQAILFGDCGRRHRRAIMERPLAWEFWVSGSSGAAPTDGNPDFVLEFERRPRAVLAADVVGYTRLMEAAELDTHRRFRLLRVGVIDPAIIAHRGEIVKNTGDGYVAVFETPSDAVRCALELQQEVRDQEAGTPPEQRIQFRMGVHWDPVIFDLDDVYGHGVNTAVRLQQVAPAGGVVISSALRDALGDTPNIDIRDLGELRLKNLSRPVRAFFLLTSGVNGSATLNMVGRSSGRARLPSVALLPFSSLTADSDDSYFAEGFIEDIITSLSNLQDLLVVSRGSTMAFRRRAIDPIEIGEKLGVQYLVSGRVSRSDQQIRLWVEFVDVATASVLWAEKYVLGLNELFQLQDEIAIKIVGKIAAHVRRTEMKRALRKPPQNMNAYDYLLRALDLLYSFDFADFSRARTLLEKAREEDPAYAAPFAFSAHWHIFNIAEGWSSNVDDDIQEVIRLSNCAIERDPSNGLALATHGHGRAMFFRDYDVAIDCVDRATTISPGNSWAWTFSSGPYGFVGRTKQAIEQAERAIRLSPIDSYAFFKLMFLGQNHYLNGTFEDAIRWSRRSLNLNPRFGNVARVLAASLVAVGRVEEARRVAAHHSQILPGFRVSDYARRCPFKEPAASVYVERLREAGIRP